MSYLKSYLILFFLIPATVFAKTQLNSAAELATLLNQFTTLQTHFTQKTLNAQQIVLQTSSGTMLLKRPGHFRWETLSPSHQIVITDGNTVWIYDVDLQQATTQSLKNMPISPAKLLSGNVNALLKAFSVHAVSHQDITTFQLKPLKKNNAFDSVLLIFSHNQLISMQIKNNMNQTTVFNFSHIVLNPNLSSSLFQFRAPTDVDVLR